MRIDPRYTHNFIPVHAKAEELIDALDMTDKVNEVVALYAKPHKVQGILSRLNGTCVVLARPHYTRAGAVVWKPFGPYIELHPRLFDDGMAVEREQTFAHEIAHFLSQEIYQHRGHGRQWKHIMTALGYVARRTHQISEIERRKLKVVGECLRCGTVIHKRKRLPRTRNIYHGGSCGGRVIRCEPSG